MALARWNLRTQTQSDKVGAAVEEEYLPNVLVPVHQMKTWSVYHIAAAHDRDMLKLPIQGYVLTKV